ncbi:MAG: magnesium transporter CorA family protein [Planctomycetota bacterium]|jgi:magnesium transporter
MKRVFELPDSRRWVDIRFSTAEEWSREVEAEGAPQLIQEAATRVGSHIQFVAHAPHLYVCLPLVTEDAEAPREYFSAFLSPGLLLTGHRDAVHAVDSAAATLQSAPEDLSELTPFGLLSALSSLEIGRAVEMAQELRSEVERISHQIDNEPDEVSALEIRKLRRRIARLGTICEDEIFVLTRVGNLDVQKFGVDSSREDWVTRMELDRHLAQALDRLERRVEEIQVAFQLHLQDRSNSRLNMLSIISAVFLPLTLIAGIYGMNFENMPELKYANAYYICLGAMGLVALVLLLNFWRTGWFD